MLRIENLSKSFGSKILLNQVTYHFPEGERIALVGANGAGKTTLLNMLVGVEPQDQGSIIKPTNLVLGFLPQAPNPNPAKTVAEEAAQGAKAIVNLKHAMNIALAELNQDASKSSAERYEAAETAFRNAGGYALEARAKKTLAGLGFKTHEFHNDPKTLSGGWRMRLEIAKLFLGDPDFLILDEPTNHLDLPSLIWVENFLKTYKGTLIFVSHDRALLNRLPTLTVHLHRGKLTAYKGNFDFFLEEREARLELEGAAKKKLERRRLQIESFINRFGAKATKASQAQSRLKMLARLRDLETEVDETLKDETSEDLIQFSLPEPSKTGRTVLNIEGGAIGYPSECPNGTPLVLSDNIGLEIGRESKIAVIGANGIGKTTLLKTIVGQLAPLGGSFMLGSGVTVAHFTQEQLDALDPSKTVIENILHTTPLGEQAARGLLGAFLFRGDDVFKPVRVLSGGEKSRLVLAKILASNVNFLILDEPTSHLDMTSIEALINALSEFSGTVLFVSHDRSFIDSICTHVFAMYRDGRSQLFSGKLGDYQRLCKVAGLPDILDPATFSNAAESSPSRSFLEERKKTSDQHEIAKDLKRDRQRYEKRRASLELRMTELKAELVQVEKNLSHLDPDDYIKVKKLCEKQKAFQDELSHSEDEWLDLSEKLESILTNLNSLGRS